MLNYGVRGWGLSSKWKWNPDPTGRLFVMWKEILKNMDSAPALSFKRQEYNPETSGLPSQQQDMFPDRSGLLSHGL